MNERDLLVSVSRYAAAMKMTRPRSLIVLIAFLVTAAFSFCTRTDALPIDYTEGRWSELVDGLRGRLIIEERPKINDSTIIGVSLELQNASEYRLTVLDDPEQVAVELFGGDGKPISPRTDLSRSGPVPFPEWKTITPGQSIQFRIESYTVGVPHGVIFIAFHDKVWTPDPAIQGSEYYLRGTFQQTKDVKRSPQEHWVGTIDLPFVKICGK